MSRTIRPGPHYCENLTLRQSEHKAHN